MKISTRLVNVSPYYMFLRQTSDTMEAIRADGTGVTFNPIQFGGLFGQKTTLQEDQVMEITEFDGGDRRNTLKVRNNIGT